MPDSLNATQLRQLKCPAKPKKLFDGGGLFLYVVPTGGKLWRLKYRFAGKEKLLALGTYPETSLAEAREGRSAARALLAKGIDPNEQRKTKAASERASRDNTFAAFAEQWYANKAGGWSEATRSKARFYLDKDLLPALGALPIAGIKRTALVDALRKIESRDALDVAKKCRGWLLQIFRFALAAGVIEYNPATDLSVVAKAAPARRGHPHIDMQELPAFLRALDGYSGDQLTANSIRLLLLTAVRPGELRHALWSEFDLEAATWAIPADRMKMRRAHVVPLPTQAVALLTAMRAAADPRTDLLFPSRDSRTRPMSENTVNTAIGRIGYKGRQTGHGFRHLISTALNERGYNRDWIERQLAHGDENEIRGIYNSAQYIDQRRQMMQEWADSLGHQKVTAIRRAAA